MPQINLMGYLADGTGARRLVDAYNVQFEDGSYLSDWAKSVGKPSIEVVSELPDVADASSSVAYWLMDSETKEYHVYTFDSEDKKFVLAGDVSLDLSGYIQDSALSEISETSPNGTIYKDAEGKLRAKVILPSGEGGSSNVTVTDTEDGVKITVDGDEHTVKNGTSVKSVTSETAANGSYVTVKLHTEPDGEGEEIGSFNVPKGDKGETGAVMRPASAVAEDGTLRFSAEGEEDVSVDFSAVRTKVDADNETATLNGSIVVAQKSYVDGLKNTIASNAGRIAEIARQIKSGVSIVALEQFKGGVPHTMTYERAGSNGSFTYKISAGLEEVTSIYAVGRTPVSARITLNTEDDEGNNVVVEPSVVREGTMISFPISENTKYIELLSQSLIDVILGFGSSYNELLSMLDRDRIKSLGSAMVAESVQGKLNVNGTKVEPNQSYVTATATINEYTKKDMEDGAIVFVDNIPSGCYVVLRESSAGSDYLNTYSPIHNGIGYYKCEGTTTKIGFEITSSNGLISVDEVPSVSYTIVPLGEIKKSNAKIARLRGAEYIPSESINLASVCMKHDIRSVALNPAKGMNVLPYMAYVSQTDEAEYGLTHPSIPGYGISTNGTCNISVTNDDENYLVSKANVKIGFYIYKRVEGFSHLVVGEGTGGSLGVSLANLSLAHYSAKFRGVQLDTYAIDEDWTWVTMFLAKDIPTTCKYRLTIFATDKFVNNRPGNKLTTRIQNYGAYVVDSYASMIDERVVYKTIPELYGSNLIGKTLCLTGDSNGGGGIGEYKRLSWAARLLGMKVIDASNGGWSMQGRMLDPEQSYYGWLYYHKWREKILETNADIYYFTQCTNDGNYGSRPIWDASLGKWAPTETESSIFAGRTFYGSFGEGDWDCIKKVVDTYTDEFATLLERGALDATYNGEKLSTICHRDMTTLGCTGAFVKEICEKQPKAVCVIDSTIGGIGVVNTLIGSFSAEGIVGSTRQETGEDGYVVYPPCLADNLDENGHPTTYISNGTVSGGEPVTEITAESELDDGNNYRLYHYFAYKDHGKVVGQDQISQYEDADICAKCHRFYADKADKYVRLSAMDLEYIRPDLFFGAPLNNKAYRAGVSNLQAILRVPFIDAAYNTSVNLFNVGRIAADQGHWNARGMRRLGEVIAHQLNNLFVSETEEERMVRGGEFERIAGID